MTLERLQLGQEGERQAEQYLRAKGYQILRKNFRSKIGEIDIIAQDGETLCFVEVRTRTSDWQGHPFESVTLSKQRKLIKTALWYLKENDIDDDVVMRFDVVSVIPQEEKRFEIDLIQNAFEVRC